LNETAATYQPHHGMSDCDYAMVGSFIKTNTECSPPSTIDSPTINSPTAFPCPELSILPPLI
jgi:hypothetical protein